MAEHLGLGFMVWACVLAGVFLVGCRGLEVCHATEEPH